EQHLALFGERERVRDPRNNADTRQLVGELGHGRILADNRNVDIASQTRNTASDHRDSADDGGTSRVLLDDLCQIDERASDATTQRGARLAAHARSFAQAALARATSCSRNASSVSDARSIRSMASSNATSEGAGPCSRNAMSARCAAAA